MDDHELRQLRIECVSELKYSPLPDLMRLEADAGEAEAALKEFQLPRLYHITLPTQVKLDEQMGCTSPHTTSHSQHFLEAPRRQRRGANTFLRPPDSNVAVPISRKL